MTNIAVCDDEIMELKYAADLIRQYGKEHPRCDINIHYFSAPLELISYVEEHGSFDLMFLDVYMAGMLGTDAARELRGLGDDSEIVFITTSRDHSIDAFELDATQYLVKPYCQERFFSTMDKIMGRIMVERRDGISIKISKGIANIAPRDVVFTETSRNNYQFIHMSNEERFEVRMTASELFKLLSNNKFFIRCGASLNLNLKYVRQISRDSITFDTGACRDYPYRAYHKLKEEFLNLQMMG